MRIIDGNIFEGMRLVLPEHRELMQRSKQELTKHTQPVLSEEEWVQFEYILTEAMEQRQTIRITLFDAYQDIVWEGVPLIKNNKLHLAREDGVQQVPLQKLVKIEAV